jgi:hypothetical protein
MAKTAEERLDLLERHTRFNGAVEEKFDRMLSEFGSRMRQIHILASVNSTGQQEQATTSNRMFVDLEGKVAGLKKQSGQMEEKLAEIDVKLDQVIRLLTPEPLGYGGS